jgi:predicted Zn-dependent peptidase
MFGPHPYATQMPSPAALRRVDDASLRSVHPLVFNPAAAHLVLVGDLQARRAVSLAADALGAWADRAGAPAADLAAVTAPRPGPLELVARAGSVQSNLRLGGPAPTRTSPDWPATSLAEQVLSGMFSSRVVANLRERNGYSYSPRSYVRHSRAGSSFVLAADVATAVTAPALVEVLYELGRIATSGITEEELEMARRHAVGRFSFDIASLPGLASVLANLAVDGTDLAYLKSYPRALIAATRQDVGEAARRHLAPHQMVTVVVGGPEVAEPLSAVAEVAVRPAAAP